MKYNFTMVSCLLETVENNHTNLTMRTSKNDRFVGYMNSTSTSD